MEEKNIQPPTANKKFDLHKVFAAVGIILIVMVIVGGGIWYFIQRAEDKAETVADTTATKVATSSAKTATNAAKDETADWKTYFNGNTDITFKCPSSWANNGIAPSDAKDDNGGFSIQYYCLDNTDNPTTYIYIDSYVEPVNASESHASYSTVNGISVGSSKTTKSGALEYTYTRKADITIFGQPALRYSMTFKNHNFNDTNTLKTFEYEGAIVKRTSGSNKIFYDLNIMGGKSAIERANLLDQLISTFKFL